MKKLYFLLAVVLFSCDIFDEEEQIPSFVYIDSAFLKVASDGSQGGNSSEIIDAHVFANDMFVGTIELPGSVPVLSEGPTKITIGGGIRNNGIFSDRIIYPFFAFQEVDLDLTPGLVAPVAEDSILEIEYFSSTQFLLEGFEGIGNVWAPSVDNGTPIINTSEDSNDGNSSGKIVLTDDFPFFQVFSQELEWDLSQINLRSDVYLELDYKGNNPIEIGIRTASPQVGQIFALGLNPVENWTKIYVELTPAIRFGQTEDFQIYLETEKMTTEDEAVIYMDNMKLLYFNI